GGAGGAEPRGRRPAGGLRQPLAEPRRLVVVVRVVQLRPPQFDDDDQRELQGGEGEHHPGERGPAVLPQARLPRRREVSHVVTPGPGTAWCPINGPTSRPAGRGAVPRPPAAAGRRGRSAR